MNILKNILSNANLKNTIIIGLGTFLGSFFSYVLQFILGRFLSVSDYGSFNALLSLSYLLGVPASVFAISVVKRVAEYTARNDRAMTTGMFKSLSAFSILLGIIIFFILNLFSSDISSKLHIEEASILIAFSVSLSLSFLNAIPMSFFQGLMVYRRWALFTSLHSFLRMALAALPAIAGLGLFAIFSGLSISAIVSYLISLLLLWKIFTPEKSGSFVPEYKKLFSFGLPVLFISVGLTFMNNIDIILVKRYLDAETTGYFAGAVTVGKILLFGCTAVSTLMFPSISALYAQRKNLIPQFKQLILIQFFLVVIGLAVYQIFPKIITTLFFGQAFLHSVSYLKMYSIFISLYVFVYFLIMFFLAIEKTKVYLLLIPGIIAQYLLMTNFNSSISQIISVDIAAASLTLILLISYLLFVIRKSKNY